MDTQTVRDKPGEFLHGWLNVWWCVQKSYASYISLLNHIPFHKNPAIFPP